MVMRRLRAGSVGSLYIGRRWDGILTWHGGPGGVGLGLGRGTVGIGLSGHETDSSIRLSTTHCTSMVTSSPPKPLLRPVTAVVAARLHFSPPQSHPGDRNHEITARSLSPVPTQQVQHVQHVSTTCAKRNPLAVHSELDLLSRRTDDTDTETPMFMRC
jgi:hypothetical protein